MSDEWFAAAASGDVGKLVSLRGQHLFSRNAQGETALVHALKSRTLSVPVMEQLSPELNYAVEDTFPVSLIQHHSIDPEVLEFIVNVDLLYPSTAAQKYTHSLVLYIKRAYPAVYAKFAINFEEILIGGASAHANAPSGSFALSALTKTSVDQAPDRSASTPAVRPTQDTSVRDTSAVKEVREPIFADDANGSDSRVKDSSQRTPDAHDKKASALAKKASTKHKYEAFLSEATKQIESFMTLNASLRDDVRRLTLEKHAAVEQAKAADAERIEFLLTENTALKNEADDLREALEKRDNQIQTYKTRIDVLTRVKSVLTQNDSCLSDRKSVRFTTESVLSETSCPDSMPVDVAGEVKFLKAMVTDAVQSFTAIKRKCFTAEAEAAKCKSILNQIGAVFSLYASTSVTAAPCNSSASNALAASAGSGMSDSVSSRALPEVPIVSTRLSDDELNDINTLMESLNNAKSMHSYNN